MPKKLGPQDPKFYDAPSREVMMGLPGKLVITPEAAVVIERVHGFSGLERGQMQEAFERRDRKPGDVVVVGIRGFPVLNITGNVDGEPQLTWLQNLVTPDGSPITNNALVRNIAEGMEKKGKTLAFAQDYLDGQNVTDSTSPIRILPNDAHPEAEKHVQYIGPNPGEDPDNDVGTAAVTTNVIDDVLTTDRMRTAVEREALRLESEIAQKTTLPAAGPGRLPALIKFLFATKNLTWVLKHSPVMKFFIGRQAANGKNGHD